MKQISHCLPPLTFSCQEVGCPRSGYRGGVRLFPHRSCHHSVPYRLLNPLPRCYCLPLLCRANQFYLLSFPKLGSRFEQLCPSLVRSFLESVFHQELCHPPPCCVSDRLTPRTFLPTNWTIRQWSSTSVGTGHSLPSSNGLPRKKCSVMKDHRIVVYRVYY